MDVSDKRFTELRALSKAITIQNNILEQSKQKDINFQLGIQKVSEPFLRDVIKKEDEIIEKLNDTVKQPDVNYVELIPINIDFKTKTNLHPSIKPILIMVHKYKKDFTGIKINNTSFFISKDVDQIIIQNEDDSNAHYKLTDGLKILLEGRGLLKLSLHVVTEQDLNNYFSIIKSSNVDINSVDYLTTLSNGGMGKVKDCKGLDLIDDDELELNNELPDNPLLLLSELRKLIAAKLSGHNYVYNFVKSILNKLLTILLTKL